jgi:aldehyde:ferredoxin oxidoreductase
MLYGWSGATLEVDLSSGNIEKSQGDRELYERYLGGKGTNARTLWERVGPEVEPFSPDNPLIIGAGVLTGTIVPSANRAVVTFRSPQTGLHHYSGIGGFWPPELKRAGYDTLIVSGRSPAPVYLWIDDDKTEIRDASHLWGKGTHETKRLIREELNSQDVQVICIGPAGENSVYGASIEDGTGSSASRGGPGAVMGDKRLKAIAVRGTKDIHVAKPSRLAELCNSILDRTGPLRDFYEAFSQELNIYEMYIAYFGNLNETIAEANPDLQEAIATSAERCQAFIDTRRLREMSCYNCGIRCKQAFRRPDGGVSFCKCQSWWAFMFNCKLIDYDFALESFFLCEQYGLDSVSVARYVAFPIDLYQNGILTRQDTDGMHLEWANPEVAFSLIEKIARREGIGDVLANGNYEAARQIGKGAEEYVHHSKKAEQIIAAATFFAPYGALLLGISDKGDATRNMGNFGGLYWNTGRQQEYVDSGYSLYPEEYEKYLLTEFDYVGDNPEPSCQIAAYDEESYCITDVTGLCNFWSAFMPDQPIHTRSLKADLISCITGMDIDEDGLTRIARRVINLVRACNIRLGLTRNDDTVPKIFFKRTPFPPLQTLDPDKFGKHIDRFYEIRGWTGEGVPTRDTLAQLDLDFVSESFERSGIIR